MRPHFDNPLGTARLFGPGLARRLTRGGVVAVLLAAAGCIGTGPLEYISNGFKVGPNYKKPPAPVAPAWSQQNDPLVQNRHLSDWWRVFEDPALDSLVRSALGQNLDLRAAGMRVFEARAQQAIAVGNIFPQKQYEEGSASRIALSHNIANNPTAIDPILANLPGAAFARIPNAQRPTNWYANWADTFNLSWELDFWGKFRRNIETANAKLEASVEDFDDALVTLLADVATNYVNFRVAQERIKIARENVRIQEGILEYASERYKKGIATSLDVEQARTLLEQTRSTIPALQITQGAANDALCTLLGLPPRDLEPELGPGEKLGANPVPHTPDWAAVGIPADLLRRRPDVRAAERHVAAQSAQVGVAEADLYPAIFINGTIGWESQHLRDLFSAGSFTGSIGPSFQWNILNYGRIVNNMHLQDAKTAELIAVYQSKVLTASREVEVSLRGFLRTQEQAAELARSVKAATAATAVGQQQYKVGTTDFNRVFNLQTTQVQQQDQLAVAQGNIALNLINVYRALGGGWELRTECAPAGHVAALGMPRADADVAEADAALSPLPPPRPR
jgi:NodT family efflux transporter outer membrane factor (OMF) lipoprotein